MGENSKIEWCDNTFNPWVGCTKVSPACDHCYAEAWASRYGAVGWGTGAPRKRTSASNWAQPHKWNKQAQQAGKRLRVFCASLADVFDNEVPQEWRDDLFTLIEETPCLDWLLLTKRIGNAAKMLPPPVYGDIHLNVWLGATVVNQEEADRDIPKLLAAPARIRFLSMEPLLGEVDIRRYLQCPVLSGRFACSMGPNGEPPRYIMGQPRVDWVIVGGESGKDARPMHPAWVRSLRDQCKPQGVAFLLKQWGEWGVNPDGSDYAKSCFLSPDGTRLADVVAVHDSDCAKPCLLMFKDGKKNTGREIDGREWNEVPLIG